jgi:predicted PurR-regulated permease PerM
LKKPVVAAEPYDLARRTLAPLFIIGLIVATFLVVQPFLAATVWATTLVIATWPLMLRTQKALGGKRWLAVLIMTIGLLLIVLLPLSFAIVAIINHSDHIIALIVALPDFRVPPAPMWLYDIPMVGDVAARQWQSIADSGVRDLARQITPYAGTISQWFVRAAGSVGGLFIHLLMTIAIAAVLYASGERAMDWCIRFGQRLAGERGEEMVRLAGMAIRSVALGVVVTAVAQSLVAGIGLWLAGIPQAGVLSAVILLLCIAQLGPLLVMVPAVIWLFATGATGAGIVVVVFAVMAVVLDNLLRPFLIKRGADLPLLLILAGVIGGLLSFGLLGLFLGPVVLAVAYTLLQHWIYDKAA